jgi:heme-degrading monooxygenase HmoA
MSELAITTGTWVVDPTKEQAFVEAWTEFVTWAGTRPGATTFRLGRDRNNEGRFVSYAAWATLEAADAWRTSPEMQEQLARVLQHVDDFDSTQLCVVATVDASSELGRV